MNILKESLTRIIAIASVQGHNHLQMRQSLATIFKDASKSLEDYNRVYDYFLVIHELCDQSDEYLSVKIENKLNFQGEVKSIGRDRSWGQIRVTIRSHFDLTNDLQKWRAERGDWVEIINDPLQQKSFPEGTLIWWRR